MLFSGLIHEDHRVAAAWIGVLVPLSYAAVGAARAASRLRCRYLLRAFNPRAKPRRSASSATAPTLYRQSTPSPS